MALYFLLPQGDNLDDLMKRLKDLENKTVRMCCLVLGVSVITGDMRYMSTKSIHQFWCEINSKDMYSKIIHEIVHAIFVVK